MADTVTEAQERLGSVALVASHEAYRQHLRPVAAALAPLTTTAWLESPALVNEVEAGTWVTASARDFGYVKDRGTTVLMEHGTGLQWYPEFQLAQMKGADLIAAPNRFVAERWHEAAPAARIEVIGTPKMDALRKIPVAGDGVVAVSFHWSGFPMVPESFRQSLHRLASEHRVIGHAHPRVFERMLRFWASLGIEPVREFEDVVARADVYLCDHSSTIYEWAALGRPVVFLQRPTRLIGYLTGLRYQAFTDVGSHADPDSVCGLTDDALAHPETFADQRQAATRELYPFLGTATDRMVRLIQEVTDGKVEGDGRGRIRHRTSQGRETQATRHG